MKEELVHKKLAAYLHDPAHKALVLFHGVGHERVAEGIRRALGLEWAQGVEDDVRKADHVAAACDRPNFPPETPSVDFWRCPVLTHPFMRAKAGYPAHFDLAGLGVSLTLPQVTRGVERVAHILKESYEGDREALYLALWRYFPDFLIRGEREADLPQDQRLGLLWHFLPADTRVPDHTIWDHLSATAAVIGALPRPAFLVFSFGLGPVQGFIAQARTTRDLWMGSYLLSFLAWKGMEVLCDEVGPDAVLYPSLREEPLVDDWLARKGIKLLSEGQKWPSWARRVAVFPNKFVVLVPWENAEDLARKAEEAIRRAWKEVAEEVLKGLQERLGEGFVPDRTAWDRQVDNQLEVYWVVLPWPEGLEGRENVEKALMVLESWLTGLEERDVVLPSVKEGRHLPNLGLLYAPLHRMAQRCFDAEKRARRFPPVEEPGYKCTLCGERQPILAGTEGYARQREIWSRAAERLRGDLSPRGRERLCAICLTKRLAHEAESIKRATGGQRTFLSTSTLAALPCREALKKRHRELQSLPPFLRACVRASQLLADVGLEVVPVREGDPEAVLEDLDGEWLFEETYLRRERELEEVEASADRKKKAYQALREAHQALLRLREEAKGIPRPSPFYAILMMDGDRMGRWVGGCQHKARLQDILHPDVVKNLAGHTGWKEALGQRRLFGPSTHAALSRALASFARFTAPFFVEARGKGRLVYAGGDDVLALLPLPEAAAVAFLLREAYRRPFVLVDPKGRVSWRLEDLRDRREWRLERHMGPDATTSGALAFVHHLYPLGAALEQVRRWEKDAKEVYKRNALVVGIIRRSGPDVHFGGPWALVEPLVSLARAFGKRDLPGRTPYLLREPGAGIRDLPGEARRELALAVLKGRERRSKEKLDEKLQEAFMAAGEDFGWDLERMSDFLMVARFLGGETEGEVMDPWGLLEG